LVGAAFFVVFFAAFFVVFLATFLVDLVAPAFLEALFLAAFLVDFLAAPREAAFLVVFFFEALPALLRAPRLFLLPFLAAILSSLSFANLPARVGGSCRYVSDGKSSKRYSKFKSTMWIEPLRLPFRSTYHVKRAVSTKTL
jgi:hypothetical protein